MNPTSFMHIFKKKQNVCKVRLLWVILYYFLGLSFRDTSKALSPFVKKEVMFQFGSGGYSSIIIIPKKYTV
jgi:hypothetical protein